MSRLLSHSNPKLCGIDLQFWPVNSSLISPLSCCVSESRAEAQPPASWHAGPMCTCTVILSTDSCHYHTHSDTAPGQSSNRRSQSRHRINLCTPQYNYDKHNTHNSALWSKARGRRTTQHCTRIQILVYLLLRRLKWRLNMRQTCKNSLPSLSCTTF